MTHLADPHTQPQFYRDVAGKRLLAWIIDTGFVLVLAALIVPFTAFTALFFFPFLFAVIDFSYRVITIANGGGTFGMRMAAIELRDVTGARLHIGQAFAHTLGFYVSWAIFPLQLVSVILMCTTQRGQSLTDLAMGSAALNRRARR